MFNNLDLSCFIWTSLYNVLWCFLLLGWWWRKEGRTECHRDSGRTSCTACWSDISNSLHMHLLLTGYKGFHYFFINMTHFQTTSIVFSWSFEAAMFLVFTIWSVGQFLWHPRSKTFQHQRHFCAAGPENTPIFFPELPCQHWNSPLQASWSFQCHKLEYYK